MNKIKRFIAYYKPYKKMFYTDMFCALLLSCVDLIFPILVRSLMGQVQNPLPSLNITALLAKMSFVMVVICIIRYYCQYYITSWGHIMGAKMEYDMRQDVFDHLQKLSFTYYDNSKTGQIMSRIVNDLFDISELAHHGPEDIFISILKILGSFTILMFISPTLTLMIFGVLPIMGWFSYFYNRKMKKVFKENRRKIAEVNAQIEDSIAGIRVVQSFANEKIEKQKFTLGNDAFLSTKEQSYGYLAQFFSSTGLFQGLMYIAVVIGGSYMVGKGSLNASDLLAFVLYVNVFLNPIEKLLNFTEQFQKGMTGFERFLEILDTEPDIQDVPRAVELTNVKGDVVFEGVSFSYDRQSHVLQDINLAVSAGSTIALVGPSGGGKSTLCSLIPRFYEVNAGKILIDGKDIKSLTLKSLRNNIGIVQQDVYLFSGTVKENILYGNPYATDREVIEAAKRANAHEFIMGLENGYDTYVGERGVKLSGGQKQRISIARVFLKNPPIVILDEATSALDNQSEKIIQESLEQLSKNRTTFVIAHRLSTIQHADTILVLTENGIEEKGTHEELLQHEGVYASLYQAQFQK